MPNSLPATIFKALQRIEPDTSQFYQSSGSQFQSSSSNNTYFAKEGASSDAEQYHGEAESLRAIYTACPGICPKLLEFSVDPTSQRPVFVSEYKKIGSLNKHSAEVLGKRLAEMHTKGTSINGMFGFEIPTYCGATKMANGWFDTWAEAYDSMIGGLLERLGQHGQYAQTCRLGAEVRKSVIPRLLGPLRIQPALLHGDLWSGNAGTDSETQDPIIFDPSSYYGHNEADLSIARIFGGFPPSFFHAYHQEIPPSEPTAEYDQRAALYELFHYLNHTVLFGRSYESSARQKMTQLLRFVTDNEQVSPTL